MTGQALQNNSIGSLTEIEQIVYIVITGIIILKQRKIMNSISKKSISIVLTVSVDYIQSKRFTSTHHPPTVLLVVLAVFCGSEFF
jgi:hypothetical protein